MILECPKCEHEGLSEASHGTSRCPRCNGLFVPRGAAAASAAEIPASEAPAGYDDRTGRCPADRTIMTRAEIALGDGRAIHLERCGGCQGVWFDAGEWNALAGAHLLDHLDEFWTAQWRARQRHEQGKRDEERRAEEAFGPELYARLMVMAQTLRGHPRRSQALAILREESKE